MSSTAIYDYGIQDEAFDLYTVTLFDEAIQTLVTNTPHMVDTWIYEIERIHRRRLHRLTVGLDVEWRPSFRRGVNNPVATLQLCVGHRCLIFQLLHAPSIPYSLLNFLLNQNYTFVGVGIQNDVRKLEENYGLSVGNMANLRDYVDEELRFAGLRVFAEVILGMEFAKPQRVRLSRWDNRWLSLDQVQYACLDAFVSFEIGRILNVSN